MDSFLKMDIFFFVTTIVVILVGILIVAILVRVYRIMRNVEHISKEASEETALIRADIDQMRGDIKRGARWGAVASFIRKTGKRYFNNDEKGDAHKKQ